jgi:hypothetical protein
MTPFKIQQVAGVALSVLGLGVAVMDFEAAIRHTLGDGMVRFFGYGALGIFGIGMLLIDSDWVFSTAQKCVSFLPWGNKGTTT